jgi:hypothetical protein
LLENDPFPEEAQLYHKLRITNKGDLVLHRIRSTSPNASTEDITKKDHLSSEP